MGLDIIGDIHGSATKLEKLLRRMGYARQSGAWRCPNRKAIFVGDFVDRGPEQLATIRIAREMVEAGSAHAIMGNHELNAIAFATRRADCDDYCRTHLGESGRRNRKQHASFLAEVEEGSDAHRSIIGWFLTLPLWIEFNHLRVVHACWDDEAIGWLKSYLMDGRLRDQQVQEVTTGDHNVLLRKGDGSATTAFRHVETLLKGVEVALPADAGVFLDADGHERDSVRVRWWDARWKTYAQAALLKPEALAKLGGSRLPEDLRLGYPEGEKPVIFGHYWMRGVPQLLGPNVTCVDFSAGVEDEPLVAYRWDGELLLHPGKFIASH